MTRFAVALSSILVVSNAPGAFHWPNEISNLDDEMQQVALEFLPPEVARRAVHAEAYQDGVLIRTLNAEAEEAQRTMNSFDKSASSA